MNGDLHKIPTPNGRVSQIEQKLCDRSQALSKLGALEAGTAGFSLVELMLVVLVIGVLTAIAIPNFSDMTGAARIARDQRNAQTIVSLTSAAQASGFTNDWGTKSNAIALIIAGISSTNGTHGSQVFSFRLDALSPANQSTAASYIHLNGNTLIYVPAGGQTD